MSTTTYDVRIWRTELYVGSQVTTYTVRWSVGGRAFRKPYRTKGHADSFRSELTAAAKKGEAFNTESGLPVFIHRGTQSLSWYAFARDYAEMKWPRLAGNSRRNTAKALTNATVALLTTADRTPRPDDKILRKALTAWSFNVRQRQSGEPPADIRHALDWLSRSTRSLNDLMEPAVIRGLLDAISRRMDGQPAAALTIQRERGIIVNALEYAVERKLLPGNPVRSVAWTAPKAVKAVDRRVVVNPAQARALLTAVGQQQPSGPLLVAFFGAMYYAGLRPGEAMNLRRSNLLIPAEGWGELLFEESTPITGASWTDSGRRREPRQLKHRAKGETRTAPCPPDLTRLLQRHLAEFGTLSDGRLFRGVRGGEVAEETYGRVWRKARSAALSQAEAASPLAHRPYDLRHAAVSTWLNAGVPPTQAAEWAGHSVAVLLQIYAKCVAGQEEVAKERIGQALRSGR